MPDFPPNEPFDPDLPTRLEIAKAEKAKAYQERMQAKEKADAEVEVQRLKAEQAKYSAQNTNLNSEQVTKRRYAAFGFGAAALVLTSLIWSITLYNVEYIDNDATCDIKVERAKQEGINEGLLWRKQVHDEMQGK